MSTAKQHRHAAVSLTPAFRPVSLVGDGHEPFQRLTLTAMSLHSYSRCWLHLIWGTLNRERILQREAAAWLLCHRIKAGVNIRIDWEFTGIYIAR